MQSQDWCWEDRSSSDHSEEPQGPQLKMKYCQKVEDILLEVRYSLLHRIIDGCDQD